MIEHATFWQDVFCIVLWIVILLTFLKGYYKPYVVSYTRRRIGILLVALFSIFSYIDGDYFNYKKIYNDVASGSRWHFEDIYFWIIENVATDYITFRVIVWGGATLLLFWAYKRLAEKIDLTLFIFVLCYLPYFAYARASVSMALIMLGLSYIVKPIKNAKNASVFCGFLLLGSSWFFHQSGIIGITAALASLVWMNVSKKKYSKLLLFFVPVAAFLMGYVVKGFVNFDLSSDYIMISEYAKNDYFTSSVNSFIDSMGGGIGFFIQNALSLGSLYITIYLYYKLVKLGEFIKLPPNIRVMAAYVFFIDLIAFGILVSPSSFSAMHYRISFFAMPANAIFLASIKIRSLQTKIYNVVFYTAAIGSTYNLFYSFYRMAVSSL